VPSSLPYFHYQTLVDIINEKISRFYVAFKLMFVANCSLITILGMRIIDVPPVCKFCTRHQFFNSADKRQGERGRHKLDLGHEVGKAVTSVTLLIINGLTRYIFCYNPQHVTAEARIHPLALFFAGPKPPAFAHAASWPTPTASATGRRHAHGFF
jgi:hypothetical protein